MIAALLLACNGEDLILPGEGEAASISVVPGNEQTGRVGATLAEAVVLAGRQSPTGTVTVTAGPGGPSCSGELDRGEGRCTLTLEQEGEFTLTAEYSGDSRHAASTGVEPHRVQPSDPGPRDD